MMHINIKYSCKFVGNILFSWFLSLRKSNIGVLGEFRINDESDEMSDDFFCVW
jgi:hypothetical protein